MCKWGTEEVVEIKGDDGVVRKIGIDKCIADIVKALHQGGVPTASHCCGHYKEHGHVVLRDGRCLIVIEPESQTGDMAKEIVSNICIQKSGIMKK